MTSPTQGERGSAKNGESLFSKMGDKGEGGFKNLTKWVTSFMEVAMKVCSTDAVYPQLADYGEGWLASPHHMSISFCKWHSHGSSFASPSFGIHMIYQAVLWWWWSQGGHKNLAKVSGSGSSPWSSCNNGLIKVFLHFFPQKFRHI